VSGGKLKIIRVLANPITRKKKKAAKRRAPIARKVGLSRAGKKTGARFVVRLVSPTGAARWWTGQSWSPSRTKARRYAGNDAAGRAMRGARKKTAGHDWIVMDALPV
jgi:hypothetical protein